MNEDHVLMPLAPELEAIGKRWQAAGVPDLYAGCMDPFGAAACRERGHNVRAFLYPKPQLKTGKIQDLEIPGALGPIPLKIIYPESVSSPQPECRVLVYFHGGGWVVGDLDSHEMHAVRLANESQCVVVNVGYRLAPEFKAPAAFDDCWTATQWAARWQAEQGVHAPKLAIGGDSAGGNLAAAVAVRARDAGLPLVFQLLLYPCTDLSQRRSLPEQAYLGDSYDQLCKDPRVSPIYADLRDVCPVILGVGRHDFLYQDNVAYAKALRLAEIELLWREYPTLNHGFFSYTAISDLSLQAAQEICRDVKGYFDRA